MKFISFGCWNKGICNKNRSNGMSLVLNDIKDKIEIYENNIIFLLGDNYYPDKVNKMKYFNEEQFISGFECMNEINLKKDIIWGNHEINDLYKFEENTVKCYSIGKILETININPMYEYFTDVSFILEDNTLILKLDTTIYEDLKDVEIQCYFNMFPTVTRTDDKNTNINNIRKHQYDKMVEYISSNFENFDKLIIMGHHPLCYSKTKIVDENIEIRKGYSLLINELIKLERIIKLSDKKITYICADVHFFEYSTIKIGNVIINQYIVGTGGADLDNPLSNSFYDGIVLKVDDGENEEKIISDYTYTVYDQKKEFGYLVYDNNFNFISVGLPNENELKKYIINYN